MNGSPKYTRYDDITDCIEQTRRHWYAVFVSEKLLTFVILVAGVVVTCTLVETLVHFKPLFRFGMLLSIIAATVLGMVFLAFRPLFRTWPDEQVAMHVESKFPELRNGLINALQLGVDTKVTAPALVDRIIGQTADELSDYDFRRAIEKKRLVWSSAAALLLCAVLVLCAVFYRNTLIRIALPFRHTPAIGKVTITKVLPGNHRVFTGDDLTITLQVENPGNGDYTARLFYKPEKTKEVDLKMASTGGDRYEYTIKDIKVPFEYRMEVARTESEKFHVTVSERPVVTRVALSYKYPPYTGLPKGGLLFTANLKHQSVLKDGPFRSAELRKLFTNNGAPLSPDATVTSQKEGDQWLITDKKENAAYGIWKEEGELNVYRKGEEGGDGHIRALVGTEVTLKIFASKRIKEGYAIENDHRKDLRVSPGGKILTRRMTVTRDGSYTIHIEDIEDCKNQDPVARSIKALPDNPPSLRFASPGRNLTVAPGDTVSLVLAGHDDFGLKSIAIFAQKTAGGHVFRLNGWQWDRPHPTKASLKYEWTLDKDKYKVGDKIRYHAVAIDNNTVASTPGQRETKKWEIEVREKEAEAREKRKAVSRWEEKLRAILEAQKKTNEDCERLKKDDTPKPLMAAAPRVHREQVDIRKATLDVANELVPADDRARQVKDALYGLSGNEMFEAIRAAESIMKGKEAAELVANLERLIAVQKKIIRVLERILDVLPRLTEKMREEQEEEEGGDLPDDVQDKLKDLAEKLKEFVKEQKKVIDATEELSKVPVDDFTKEDEEKLKDLEAIEDKWSKFLKEAHSDMSKIPEQDFSNPTMSKELIEVQSEVEMAKDALKKKATEIATALEDNGAELAEALTTHIEKWLPDTPDREKWQMEEPLGDYETPMAELPKELEDLIGDLMEEEEDLFEDMEDASSSWADSIDKGAGWDAMDGPISNMSAQGVTGNRLPNNSEIGGRSGEGRTGKSSGEFVEESAVGKGGRKTPTRLTPDPYEKGEVDDTSTDPAGGSTGGGKKSGAGGEGLEGPPPPEVDNKIKGFMAKQAELRNKAEKIKLDFKVATFPTMFEESLKDMKAIEDDLANSRYQNVLRRKNVMLRRLGDTRTLLQGEIEIQRDRSVGLPDYLQEDIKDAMGGELPREFEELLKGYYEVLSTMK